VLAAQAVPDLDTQASREGDAAHWVVANSLEHVALNSLGDLPPDFMDEGVGQTAPNGIIVDQEIVDSATVMVDDVLSVCQFYNVHPRELKIEYRVHTPTIHADNWGTLDVALDLRHQLRGGKLYLWDFKHGHGQVNAKHNLQSINYLEGLRHEWSIDGWQDQGLIVHSRIVQPRCFREIGPVDEWICNFADIRPFVNVLHSQALEADQNPQMCAGKHCRYCPARIRCPANRQANYALIDWVKLPYEIETMGGPDLAFERQIIEDGLVLMKSRLEAIDDDLGQRIRDGATDTGFVLQAGQGREKYTVPAGQAISLAAQFGFDISKLGVLTPTQSVAKAPKAIRSFFKQAMKKITTRNSTGLQLVPASESKTARAFQPRGNT
jgi:hypothetical protein